MTSVNFTVAATNAASTSIVFRECGGVTGLRECIDATAHLSVLAFPVEQFDQVVGVRSLAFPACYMLTSSSTAYVGESGNVGVRLAQHVADQAKGFATEIFIIGSPGGRHFDKSAAIFLQHDLSKAVELGSLVSLTKGRNPQIIELDGWRRSTLEQLGQIARRLLFDAGCRAIHSNNPRVLSLSPDTLGVPAIFPLDPDESKLMKIGIPTAPHGCEELQLNYANLWARGHAAGEDFVVHAGSEVRVVINQSVNPIFFKRRKELVEAGALESIRGVDDRQRLTVSVAFASAAIAAKVVTGAHVNANTWQKMRQAMIVAA